MRKFNYTLTFSKSGKSLIFKVGVDDIYGERYYTFSILKGWRKDLANKHLKFENNEWDIDTIKSYIGFEILKVAKDKYEGIKLINIVKGLNIFEVHFWASKLLINKKARRAFKIMYL
jgi:hypothetical protein